MRQKLVTKFSHQLRQIQSLGLHLSGVCPSPQSDVNRSDKLASS